MNQYLLSSYLPALASTVAAELGVAMLFGFWSLRQISVVVLMHFVTHPALHVVLWAGYWWHGVSPSLPVVLALELGVVVAEGSVLRHCLRMPTKSAFVLSGVMNAFSYGFGLTLSS